jgi:hypothetical protein
MHGITSQLLEEFAIAPVDAFDAFVGFLDKETQEALEIL